MRKIKGVALGLAGIVVLTLCGLAGWLAIAPPDLVRVAAGYTAKIVCSNVFVAGRDAETVLEIDVQAPGHPLLRFMHVDVDSEAGTVRADLLGLFGKGLAVHQAGFGCSTVPDGRPDALPPVPAVDAVAKPDDDQLWPAGNKVLPLDNAALNQVLDDAELAGPGMRAIVVVKDGRIVAERYGEGFDMETPLIGWSMTKSLTATLIGLLIEEGRMQLESQFLSPDWGADKRAEISLADMLGMASGLDWNEGYGGVSDVTRMLYLEPDMARFVAGLPLSKPDGTEIGQKFTYSTGITVFLSAYWQGHFDLAEEALLFPRQGLFDPLGMSSAILETDARGTFAGGSYLYATGRDWARFGQFFLQKGVWNGTRMLPEGFTDWMAADHPASKDKYGQGHVWVRQPGFDDEGENPTMSHKTTWFSGHDGQSVAVVAQKNLVVVRLGLTPRNKKYKPANLVNAVAAAFD